LVSCCIRGFDGRLDHRVRRDGMMTKIDNPAPFDEHEPEKARKLAPIWRAVIEIGFILFLFYSNLLMGEFTRANSAHGKTLVAAMSDIFTPANFGIGVVSALIGYVVVEYLRAKL
jgi:hypothetical protein